MKLKVKNEMTSLELVEQINMFRQQEGNPTELKHKSLLAIIREEFEQEIIEQKILPNTYKDKIGRKMPMFILTLNQSKQVLLRESKFVRRAIIQYIEELEQALQEPKKEQRGIVLLKNKVAKLELQLKELESRELSRKVRINGADVRGRTCNSIEMLQEKLDEDILLIKKVLERFSHNKAEMKLYVQQLKMFS